MVFRHSKLSRSAVVASVEPPVLSFHAPGPSRRAPSPMSSAFACLHTCHLANKEIRLADSPLFGGGVWIIRRGQHLPGRHLAKIQTDDRSRPLGHLELRHSPSKLARPVLARLPDRRGFMLRLADCHRDVQYFCDPLRRSGLRAPGVIGRSRLDPDKPEPYYNWGITNFCAGLLSQAAADLDRSSQLNPRNSYTATLA